MKFSKENKYVYAIINSYCTKLKIIMINAQSTRSNYCYNLMDTKTGTIYMATEHDMKRVFKKKRDALRYGT